MDYLKKGPRRLSPFRTAADTVAGRQTRLKEEADEEFVEDLAQEGQANNPRAVHARQRLLLQPRRTYHLPPVGFSERSVVPGVVPAWESHRVLGIGRH